jgi:hypothetical protein
MLSGRARTVACASGVLNARFAMVQAEVLVGDQAKARSADILERDGRL